MRERGAVSLAGRPPQPVRADFVLLRGGAPAAIAAARERAQRCWRLDIAGVDALEAALRAGADWAACTIAARSEPRDAQPIAPQVRRVCQLLNRVLHEPTRHRSSAEIKADVASVSPAAPDAHGRSSAVAERSNRSSTRCCLFGRDQLYRWLSCC
jgi:hypothetical protein